MGHFHFNQRILSATTWVIFTKRETWQVSDKMCSINFQTVITSCIADPKSKGRLCDYLFTFLLFTLFSPLLSRLLKTICRNIDRQLRTRQQRSDGAAWHRLLWPGWAATSPSLWGNESSQTVVNRLGEETGRRSHSVRGLDNTDFARPGRSFSDVWLLFGGSRQRWRPPDTVSRLFFETLRELSEVPSATTSASSSGGLRNEFVIEFVAC